MPAAPRSEAGSNTFTTNSRTRNALLSRDQSVSSTMDTGCGTTNHRPPPFVGCPTSLPRKGIRIVASVTSTNPWLRSTTAARLAEACGHSARVNEPAVEAKNRRSHSSKVSGLIDCTKVGSPSCSVNWPNVSSSSSSRSSLAGKARSSNTALSSFPFREVAPMTATRRPLSCS
jgi:hypothetical protein